jgi:hypothetical protein
VAARTVAVAVWWVVAVAVAQAVVAGPVVAAQAVAAGPVVAARAVVAGPAVAALQVYPGRAAAPEEVAPFWVAPVPPVCSFRTAERLAHLSAASFQAMSALTACPKEAAPQASEVAHPVL